MEYTQPFMTMPVHPNQGDGGFGGGNWMNNPFAYLIWIYALRWMNPNGDFGGNGQAAAAVNATQIDDVRATVNQILSDVSCGNANGMRFLDQIQNEARANGVALTNIGGQICDAKTAVISQLSDMQWRSSADIANVINSINQCCCATQGKIDSLGCGIEKEILNQTNQLQGQLSANQAATQSGFNAVTNGIGSLGYAIQQNDCNLRQLIASEGCATRQLMRDLHTEDILATKDATIASLQGKIFENSQASQTAAIIAALKTTSTTTTA